MAINKRKVLDAARKHAQKGAKQKALKEYNKLVQADPRDAKLLLEIGDVYRRWGQAEEAIAQYTKVANQFKQDGFDARSVAVLKQILNLDPKRYTAHVSLAELYQRMGLDSDAVAALRTAADGYYREGRRKEALELLRKMAALDPSNTTSRLKVADLLQQEGLDDDAITEFREIIEELRRQDATEQICVVQERILEVRPDDVATLTSLAQNLSDQGFPERAEPFAMRALEGAREPDQFELLGGIYKSLGNEVKLADITRELADYYKGRGEEDRAHTVLQRLPPGTSADAPSIGDDRSEFDESEVSEEELLDDEDFLVTDATDQSEVEPVLGEPGSAGAAVSDDELPEGDPDQLLAEASVYLRYGKRAQAIASLRSALRQEPDHRAALEKLGDAYAEDGADQDAIGCWQQAAEIARKDGDAESLNVLRDRIGALDPKAAADVEPMTDGSPDGPASIEPPGEGAPALDGDLDLDFDLDVAETTDVSEVEEIAAAGNDDLEFDLDAEMGGALGDDEPDEAKSFMAGETQDLEEPVLDDESEFEVEVDLGGAAQDEAVPSEPDPDGEIEIDFDDAVGELDDEAEPDVAASAELEESTTTSAQIQEDLEEAEFYLQQGLEGEAEGIFRGILKVAPNHPTALLKLGELEARRGNDPASVSGSEDAPEASAAADDIAIDIDMGGDALPGDDEAVEALADEPVVDDVPADAPEDAEAWSGPELSDDLAAVLAEAEAAVEAGAEPGEDTTEEDAPLDVDVDLDLGDQAPADEDTEPESAVAAPPTPEGAEAPRLGDPLGDDATEVEALAANEAAAPDPHFPREPVQAEPDAPIGVADDTMPMPEVAAPRPGDAPAESSRTVGNAPEATFDLAAELADVFADANADDVEDPKATTGSTVEDGFESIFADFKKGVTEALDDGDYDTRFDLGIAYREMGLFDDAIGEFTACLGSSGRKLESLHMMALCAMELERHGDAVSHLEQALATSDLPADRLVALQFDLGRAQRRTGDVEAARRAFGSVEELDRSFPGLTDEIAALSEAGSSPAAEAGEPDEELESFADIMDDDDEPAAAVAEPETFESFDDVITELEADDAAEASAADASDTAAAADANAETRTSSPPPGRKKKKKISFV